MSEKLQWALNIMDLQNLKNQDPEKFLKKTITKKGVLWLGQTCNLSCYFCYFAKKINDSNDIYHDFMPIEKAKKICHTLRYIYGNTSIDIQGGEPTIYPKIFELIKYCHEIGLEPTLITNGYVLHKKKLVEEYKKSGIKDFLISVHTLGEDYDKIVGLNGASEKQMKAIKNLQEVGISFRFNCTLTRQVFDGIKDISKLAVLTHAKAVNFIVFNPNEDQANNKETRTISNVPKYSEISEVLEDTIGYLEKNDIEVNIRYLPLCMISKEYRKNIYGMYQVPYDHNEWDFNSWTWTTRLNQRSNTKDLDDPLPILLYNLEEYNNIDFTEMSKHGTTTHYLKDINLQEYLLKLFSAHIPKKQLYYNNSKLRVEKHLQYQKSDKCLQCDVQDICDGIHRDYLTLFGDEEISPIFVDKRIKDPKYYIKKQWKRI